MPRFRIQNHEPRPPQTPLYERLHFAVDDLGTAMAIAKRLLEKGWHFEPHTQPRNSPEYLDQLAFATTFVVTYARPFTKSHGWPEFPQSLLPYDAHQLQLHEQLIDMRHQLFAHSDSAHHEAVAVTWGEGQMIEVSTQAPRTLTKAQLDTAIAMIDSAIPAIRSASIALAIQLEATQMQQKGLLITGA